RAARRRQVEPAGGLPLEQVFGPSLRTDRLERLAFGTQVGAPRVGVGQRRRVAAGGLEDAAQVRVEELVAQLAVRGGGVVARRPAPRTGPRRAPRRAGAGSRAPPPRPATIDR